MATLTSEFQYLGRSAKMAPKSGSYGYYILLYGKTVANAETGIHTVTIQERMACTVDSSFYNFSSSYSGTINGETVFSGTRKPSASWEYDTFTAGGYTYKKGTVIAEASLEVDASDGLVKSIPLFCTWKMTVNASVNYVPANGTTGTVSVTVDLPSIPRASTVTATDAFIGSVSTIFINKTVPSYTHTLSYIMSGQSDYTVIEEKTTKSQCAWTIPESAYESIPASRYVYITIKCETFNGNTSKGVRYAYILGTAREDLCKPEVTATAEDVNEASLFLTGDAKKIVKGISALRVLSTATAKNSASVKAVTVSVGGKTASGEDVTIEGAESASVSVVVTDTRDYSATYIIPDLSLIEYIPLTLNPTIQRESPGSDTVNIEVSGNYFNGSFGTTDNTLSVKARSRILNGEYGEDYIDLTIAVSGNSYIARGEMELSYSNIYEVEIVASDAVSTRTVVERTKKGIPIFHWGEDYFRFRVPAVIQSESPPIVEGTGTTDAAINTEIYSYAAAMNDGYFKFVYNPAVSHSLLGGDSLLVECFKIGNEDFAIWLKVSSISQLPYVKVYVANYQKTVGWIGWTSLNGVTPVSYVTNEYTSGIWTVRRWSNNVAELWGRYTATVDIKTTWVSNVMYYAPNAIPSQTFPVTFKSVPFIQVTPAGVDNAYILCTNSDGDNPSTTKTGAWQVCAPYGRNDQGIDVSFYVRGTV